MSTSYFIDDEVTVAADEGSAPVPVIRFGGPAMRACVAPSRGAELCSLEVLRTESGGGSTPKAGRARNSCVTWR